MPMFRSVRHAWPLVLLSLCLGSTCPAVALDRLCMMGAIDFRPPAKVVRDQQLKRLMAEVEQAKDALATDQDHLDYWWGEARDQKCFPIGKPGQSADCQHIVQSIGTFASSVRELESDFETKKAALDDFLKTTAKGLKDEAGNADKIAQCTTAALAAPTPTAPLGATSQSSGLFTVELSVNKQGCLAMPDKPCLKEFDIKRGKDAPTPPLTIVATMVGFPTDNYSLILEGRRQTKECTGATCTWTLPGFKATDPIPLRDDFDAGLKWLAKKDRQRDKGGAGNLVDGITARVYVHYPE